MLKLLALIVAGCGPSAARVPAAPANIPVVRIVPQVEIHESQYRFTTRSARYAVFADLVVDLSSRRVSSSDLSGIVGVADEDSIIARIRSGQYQAIDLRRGTVKPIAKREGRAAVAAAPEQDWSADAGDGSNPDPAIVAPPVVSEVLHSLAQRKAARVLDIKRDGSELVTGSEDQVCVWSLTELARQTCVPRKYQAYSYLADGRLLASNATLDGSTTWYLLDQKLAASPTQSPVSLPLVPSEVEWPCAWDVEAGPYQNVFRRAGVTLFTLHDLGPDWAIVLPDGRYLANASAPAGLAVFNAHGELADPGLVTKLHQPAKVRASLRISVPEGCPF